MSKFFISKGFKGTRGFRLKPKSKVDQALSIAKSNKKKLSTVAEMQLTVTENAETAFNATPIVKYLLPAGSDLKTMMTSVQLRGIIKRNVASDAIDDYRFDLVLDREPAGTAVTPLLVYGSASPELGDFKNINLLRRFKILRTMIGAFGESGNGVSHKVIEWFVKLNLIAECKSAGFSQANITKNALYLIYWTTSGANQPTIKCQTRIHCRDA